jgi:hypothetical protein
MKKGQTKRTFEECSRIARKYKTRGEFSQKARNVYMSAYSNGWLDEICVHMVTENKPNGFWTYDSCKRHALECTTKTEFMHKYPSAYSIASREGWIIEICSHMVRPSPKRVWTKERCQKEALKYNSRITFFLKSPAAYSAASKQGWIKDICRQIPYQQNEPGHWTKNNCRIEAAKYRNKADFRRLSSSAYVATKRNGWIKELCSHMVSLKKHPDGTITKEYCKKIASKYETKTEFQKNNQSVYNKALKKGWLISICKHMKYIGNLHSRAIYAYEFSDKSVYVGLTYNYKQRALRHQTDPRSPVYKKIKAGFTFKLIQDNKWYSADKVKIEEEKCIQNYRKRNFTILNRAKAGGLGGNSVKWTPEELKRTALKYKTRGDFQKYDSTAYTIAWKKGLLDNLCIHMQPKRGDVPKYTLHACVTMAKKCKYRSEFAERYPGHYAASRSKYDVNIICKNMSKKKIKSKWTVTKIKQHAKKFWRRSDFKRYDAGAYSAAKRLGIIDQVCTHMKNPPRANRRENKTRFDGSNKR